MSATIRKLLASDRNDINEISKQIWDGHDYLPAVADDWLKDPTCHFYGVEADGHIVAVGNLRLVEGGRTGWMEGLRVHLEYRGRGFANEITRYLVKKAEDLGVHRLRYTTSDENTASLKLAEMAGFSKLFKMSVLWSVHPKTAPTVQGNPPIQETNPAAIYTLLRTNPGIIPHGILIHEWKALDEGLQSLEEIGRKHKFYVAQRNGKLHSLSFGYPRREQEEIWWSITVYADDSQGFLSQLSCNLAMALEVGSRGIVCTFESRFEETLAKVNLESEEQSIGHLVLLEKKIQTHEPHLRSPN
jgi:N-acetylglutamate synthase-like GNAT family acetyltransferase